MRKLALCLAITVMVLTGIVLGSRATADESDTPVGPSVVGIHAPCPVTHPWPGKDVSITKIKEQLAANYGLTLTGNGWSDAHREQIRIVWQSLDAVACTDFMATITEKNGQVGLNAGSIRGYAWGDWSLTKGGHVTFDFAKWAEVMDDKDPGKLSRLVIHELTHAWNSDRFGNPAYWREFQTLAKKEGHFSEYAGSKDTEILAETVGYYVARCAKDNPYDTPRHKAYYEWVRKNVFDGREFGPGPGKKAACDVTAEDIAATTTPSQPAWIKALTGSE
ncbi:MAG: hypothetical protein Q4D89_09375 [Arachnia propionica]|uniref:hypothetical protein n=1 Tax=Arachnia propionica TaxID=1750 RepID=UPI002701D30A|nr:hypothetical protein [Arachnia propionica]